jgi:hypothetical protein
LTLIATGIIDDLPTPPSQLRALNAEERRTESGETVLAFVSAGKGRQANLRARPHISATFRSGWRYATVEGRADIAGPDDPQPWLRPEALPLLLRGIFTAAGGSHDDWADYDRTMLTERRAAVLIRPTQIYSVGS